MPIHPFQLVLSALPHWAGREQAAIKQECQGRVIIFSERQLRSAVSDYFEHYQRVRNHQGLAN